MANFVEQLHELLRVGPVATARYAKENDLREKLKNTIPVNIDD